MSQSELILVSGSIPWESFTPGTLCRLSILCFACVLARRTRKMKVSKEGVGMLEWKL
jgi:hypothetical protein